MEIITTLLPSFLLPLNYTDIVVQLICIETIVHVNCNGYNYNSITRLFSTLKLHLKSWQCISAKMACLQSKRQEMRLKPEAQSTEPVSLTWHFPQGFSGSYVPPSVNQNQELPLAAMFFIQSTRKAKQNLLHIIADKI